MKLIIITMMIFIAYNLFSALKILMVDTANHQTKTTNYLGWRVALSLSLFFIFVLGALFGYIPTNPHPASL